MFPDEVGKIGSPYALISMAGENPLMLIAPDLSFYKANQDFGLGDKKHNEKIFKERSAVRKARLVSNVQLWGIWKSYEGSTLESTGLESGDSGEDQRISFL